MYIPKHFEITDKEEIFSFIEENAFGQLISNVGGRLFTTHLPFLVSEDKTKLLGHLAVQNPQKDELEGQEVLVTFEGPHEYISPTWYASPGVPTWNYQSVHIYGDTTIISNPAEIRLVVDSLSHKYESSNEKPWKPEYKDSMLGAIVAFEVEITEVQCQYKLCQNWPPRDRKQVMENLKNNGSTKLAKAMERNGL